MLSKPNCFSSEMNVLAFVVATPRRSRIVRSYSVLLRRWRPTRFTSSAELVGLVGDPPPAPTVPPAPPVLPVPGWPEVSSRDWLMLPVQALTASAVTQATRRPREV